MRNFDCAGKAIIITFWQFGLKGQQGKANNNANVHVHGTIRGGRVSDF